MSEGPVAGNPTGPLFDPGACQAVPGVCDPSL